MQYSSSQVSPNPAPSVAAAPQPAQNALLTSFLIIFFVLSLLLASVGYKKYHAHQRSRLLKRQVAMLEAMWRISSTKRER
ncbi:MAG: hypothetical protein RBJ76_20570 [Stenomitos frigidus ULC029]